MSPLFWLDVTASSISVVIATSLLLLVLGFGPRRALNRSFALFALAMTVAALLNVLTHLALQLDMDNPSLLAELSYLAQVVMGVLLLMFTVRYLDRRTRRTDLAAGLGLATAAVLCVPLFHHQLILDLHLDANSLFDIDLSPWGLIGIQISQVCTLWSLLLFWQERHRTGEPYLASGVLILNAGFILEGILRLVFPGMSFPITSVTATLGVAVLGYGVISQQIFNPLRELTTELEHKVEKRTRELERAYKEVEKRVEERTTELKREIIERARAEDEAHMLFNASQRLAAAPLQAQEIAEIAVRQLAGVMESTECSFSLLDPQQDELRVLADFWIEDGVSHWQEIAESIPLSDYRATARVMGTLQPLVVQASDPDADPAELAYMQTNETETLAIIPLAIKGQAIGIMELETKEARHYTSEQLNMAMTLANQAAVALDNARLYEAVQQELNERAQAEDALRESEERFRMLIEQSPFGIEVFDLDGVLVQVNKAWEQIWGAEAKAVVGRHNPLKDPQIAQLGLLPLIKRIFAGESVNLPDTEFDPAKSGMPGRKRFVRSHAYHIRDQAGQVQNIVILHDDITGRMQTEQALHRKSRQQEHLIEAARHLTASLDVKEVLSRIGSGAREILRAHGCAIYLLEEDGETLNPVVAIDPLYEQEVLLTPLNVETSFTGQAVKAKRGMIFNDAGMDPSGQQIPGTPQWDEEHVIVAPFVADDVVLGAMTLSHGSKRFSEEDLALAETFASYAVTALKNAQAHRDLQHEVDERKRAEKALRESEERHRRTLEAAPDSITITRVEDGLFLQVNEFFSQLLGYSRQQALGKTPFDLDLFVNPADRGRFIKILKEKGQVNGFEVKYRRKDGTTIDTLLSARPLRYNKQDCLIAVVTDITKRKQAEAEILRLQRLLQNITDSMPSALIALDPEGQILLWNPAAETLSGQTAAQVQGQSLWQACPELARYRDLFEQVLQERQMAHRRQEPLATEIGTTYYDVDVFPLAASDLDTTDSPSIEGAGILIDDVTRWVQLEEMMLQSAKMASVGKLAAGIAHEINNPLGAMMQSAQMLQIAFDTQRPRTRERLQECGVDAEGLERYLQVRGSMEYLDGIRAAGARAAKIVTDLLSFSRRKSSKIAPHDLNTLLERALDLAGADHDLKKKYDFRDIEIVRELAPDLPKVVCDGQQVQQVVLNLARNAAQAMVRKIERGDREGAYQPRLTLRTALSGSETFKWVRLEVEDNGPGIPEAARARLFEPFFTTKAVGEGTGLGLWLCWSIVVERNGGRIWEEPGTDGGARFVVELPVAWEKKDA